MLNLYTIRNIIFVLLATMLFTSFLFIDFILVFYWFHFSCCQLTDVMLIMCCGLLGPCISSVFF